MKKLILLIFLMAFILGAWGPPTARVWWSKTTAPTVTDDETYGYRTGDFWIDETNNKVYVLLDEGTGIADWDLIQEAITEGSLGSLITSGDIKDGEIVDADISPTAAISSDKIDQWTEDISGVTNLGTYTPPDARRVKALLTANADPSGVTIAKTNASDGDVLLVYNSGTSPIVLALVDTVMQMPYTVTLAQHESIPFTYHTDRWVPDGLQSELNIKSIATPTHLTSELNDTTSPHTLLASEIKNSYLTNHGSGTTVEWDFPVRSEGWSFGIVCEAAFGMILDPNGTEQWYLNGTQLAAGEAIELESTVATVGESIWCISTKSGVYCESKYSDWAVE